MTDTPTVALTDDVLIPLVGFGTYLIPDEEAPAAAGEALRAGYRHIDTAEGYQNEAGVGRAIRTAIDDHLLKRNELFVTTKLLPGNLPLDVADSGLAVLRSRIGERSVRVSVRSAHQSDSTTESVGGQLASTRSHKRRRGARSRERTTRRPGT